MRGEEGGGSNTGEGEDMGAQRASGKERRQWKEINEGRAGGGKYSREGEGVGRVERRGEQGEGK